MKFQLTYQLDLPSLQAAVSLRDQTRDFITSKGGTVLDFTGARMTETYTVYGWDTAGAAVFAKEVQANSKAEAGTVATGGTASMQVTYVARGGSVPS